MAIAEEKKMIWMNDLSSRKNKPIIPFDINAELNKTSNAILTRIFNIPLQY